MKKLSMLTAACMALVFMSFHKKGIHTDIYKVDTKMSSLEWYAEKMTGKHNGTIMFSKGDLMDNHGNFTGRFDIDMKTIVNKDMESAEKRSKLEAHLKSADFFDSEKFPLATFVLSSLTPLKAPDKEGHTHTAKGMLTIKDKTNEISFDAAVKKQDNKISCTGSVVVDRAKFDVRYGSKTFFADIGDKMIYDNFTLKFNIVAVK